MPLNTSNLTVPVPAAAAPVSIRFPAGIRMSGQLPTVAPATKLENAAMALGRMTSGLGPLAVVFTVIEAVIAIKEFAEAVPQLIVNPEPVVEAIQKLVRAVGKLIGLVPQLSLPVLVFDVVAAAIALLQGLTLELQSLSAQVAKLDAAEAMVVTAPALAPVIAAGRADVVTQMANLEVALGEVGTIIGVVNALGSAVGLPEIPVGGALGSDPTAAAAALAEVVVALEAVRDAIPL